MKKLLLVLFLLSMTSILAQDLESYTKLLQSNISADKVNIITFNMMFTESESKKFWPIYSEYEAEVKKLGNARFALIKDFADNYLNMTDEKAEEIMDNAFDYREARLELKKDLWDTLKDELGSAKAAKFIQLDSQIQLLIDLRIAAELPLIEKTAIKK
jgi:hypothetical protein